MKNLLLALMLVSLVGCQQDDGAIPSLGTLEVHRVAISADSSEPIIQISVKEGDEVRPGDVLMRQDPTRDRALLDEGVAAAAAAKAALDKAEKGPRTEDIAVARANLAAAASDAKTALLQLRRLESLIKQKLTSQNSVDLLLGQYDAAVAKQRAAQAQLKELLAGTRIEDIEAARANFKMAQAQVVGIEISLARTTITSPIKGKVESIINHVGERPEPGAAVMVLVEDEQPYARVNVPEPLRTRLQPGAIAEVHIDGYAKAFPGKLRWIAHDASYTPYFALTQRDRSRLSYLADVVLTGQVANIPTGVPVQVYFPDVR